MRFTHIDCHTHVNFSAYDEDRDEVVQRALDAGVAMINVGTQKDTSLKAIEMAERYETGVYAIIGIHPIHTDKSHHDEQELGEGNKEFTSRGEVFDHATYRSLAKHPKVVGIGECGLDFYRMEHESWNMEHSAVRKQEEVFRQHIELAIEVNKPLMLHVRSGGGRSAYLDALSILKSYNLNLESPLRGNFHFFAGSWDEAKEILDAGFFLSFTGVLTFAQNYEEVVRNTPLERILTETDAPYVSPVPFRGKRNEPMHVREVVKAIARIKKQDEEEVRIQVLKNAEHFFNITLP